MIIANLAISFAIKLDQGPCYQGINVCEQEAGPLLRALIKDPKSSPCCLYIADIVGANRVDECICIEIKNSKLEIIITNTLSALRRHFPIVGGRYGGWNNDPLDYSVSLSPAVLRADVAALIEACGYDPHKYKCSSF
ncbi:hypothetical protein RND81_13G029700 [Saponaria officinalis]|uniref:Uncharacterized protein n=1 Tax=Saponaria officinalis TaxID=3572 RepID=A0AAW1GZU0_SAPOF